MYCTPTGLAPPQPLAYMPRWHDVFRVASGRTCAVGSRHPFWLFSHDRLSFMMIPREGLLSGSPTPKHTRSQEEVDPRAPPPPLDAGARRTCLEHRQYIPTRPMTRLGKVVVIFFPFKSRYLGWDCRSHPDIPAIVGAVSGGWREVILDARCSAMARNLCVARAEHACAGTTAVTRLA